MENIVTSFETSRKLKELGVEQDHSLFLTGNGRAYTIRSSSFKHLDYDYYTAAFTAEEFGTLLRKSVLDLNLEAFQASETWQVTCNFNGNLLVVQSETMAEALGLLLVKILENNKQCPERQNG